MRLRPLSMALYAFLLFTFAAVTSAARVVSRDPPKVTLPDQGALIGREVVVTRTQKVRLYLGIPFAAPPVSDLRFSPPKTNPLPSWEGVKNATTFQPACMQSKEKFNQHDKLKLQSKLFPEEDIEFSEDCLYLNVYVPDGSPPTTIGWSVLVWFHPGDFSVGAASLWDASVFSAKQKVIVVTPSYRLNIFGFFTTLDEYAPGNYGMLDQIAALDWVQNQIVEFGGDKDSVTIAGHTAGAVSVGLHVVSPLSKEKFSRAIQMSGSALTPDTLKQPDPSLRGKLAYSFTCFEATSKIVSCLRKIPSMSLLKESDSLATYWGPIVDVDFVNTSIKPFLPTDPLILLQEGRFNRVPLLAGYTDMEEALSFNEEDDQGMTNDEFRNKISDTVMEDVPEPKYNDSCTVNGDLVIESVLFFYTPPQQNSDSSLLREKYVAFTTERKYAAGIFRQAAFMSKFEAVYIYRFDYKLKTLGIIEFQDWVNVPQMCELPFVWGMPYLSILSPQIVWNSADKKVADTVMSLWGNFTRYSQPTPPNGRGFRWEPYSTENPVAMILDKNLNMTDPFSFDYKALTFWNDYFHKIVDASNICCNTSASSSIERYNLLTVHITVTISVFHSSLFQFNTYVPFWTNKRKI